MTTSVPHYYGISFGNGQDQSTNGVPHFDANVFVKTDRPEELVRLCMIDSVGEEGMADIAKAVEVVATEEGKFRAMVKTNDHGPYTVCEVYPANTPDPYKSVMWESIEDAFRPATLEFSASRLIQNLTDAMAEFEAAHNAEDKTNDSPKLTGDDWLAASGRRIAARDGYVAAILAMGGSKIEFANKDGSQGAFVSTGTEADKPWRVTRYDDRGFTGHSDRPTKENAVLWAILDGYTVLAPGKFKEFSQKPSFAQGEVAREEFRKREAMIRDNRAAMAENKTVAQTDAEGMRQ